MQFHWTLLVAFGIAMTAMVVLTALRLADPAITVPVVVGAVAGLLGWLAPQAKVTLGK